MPTIVAICPYCRAGGVRAPDTAIGASATCPKCKSSYTVLPEDNLPGWAASAKPDAKSFSADAPEKPRPAALSETRTTAAMPDRTEPSPVIPAEPKEAAPPRAGAAPLPAAAQPEVDDASEPTDLGAVGALLALILVGPAVIASQLPFGRFLVLGVAGVGLLGGLLCLGAEGRARLFAAGAAFAHAMVIVLVLFLPTWLHLDPWDAGATANKEDERKAIAVAVEHGSGQAQPYAASDWLAADRLSWQRGDARVTVRSAVGPVALTGPGGAKKTTKEPYLRVTVQVANTGFAREIALSGWAAGPGGEGVRASDAHGKPLKPAKFEEGWAADAGRPASRIPPGQSSEVALYFAAPPPKATSVRVQLPGAAVGSPDEIKFRVGAAGLLPAAPAK